jgi:hypothetical protein
MNCIAHYCSTLLQCTLRYCAKVSCRDGAVCLETVTFRLNSTEEWNKVLQCGYTVMRRSCPISCSVILFYLTPSFPINLHDWVTHDKHVMWCDVLCSRAEAARTTCTHGGWDPSSLLLAGIIFVLFVWEKCLQCLYLSCLIWFRLFPIYL